MAESTANYRCCAEEIGGAAEIRPPARRPPMGPWGSMGPFIGAHGSSWLNNLFLVLTGNLPVSAIETYQFPRENFNFID